MTLTRRIFTLATLATPLLAPSLHAARGYQIDTMLESLDAPWAFGFAAGGILITERDGHLRCPEV